jgi:hypothetical protein
VGGTLPETRANAKAKQRQRFDKCLIPFVVRGMTTLAASPRRLRVDGYRLRYRRFLKDRSLKIHNPS